MHTYATRTDNAIASLFFNVRPHEGYEWWLPNGWPLTCGRASCYHDSCRAWPPAQLKPAAVSFSLLDGTRLTPHERDKHENVYDKHARYDEGRAEPGGANLSRYLQMNPAAEIEKEVTEPTKLNNQTAGIASRPVSGVQLPVSEGAALLVVEQVERRAFPEPLELGRGERVIQP